MPLPLPLGRDANGKMIAGALAGSGAKERLLLHEILQFTGSRGPRSSREPNVVFGAEAAFEPTWALAHHPGDGLVLSFVELASQAVIELGLRDEEFDKLL
jgi:hypothetical protein